MTQLAIVGAGSWGTALSIALSSKFELIRLWAYDDGLAVRMRETRRNDLYLPGFTLPGNIEPEDNLQAAVSGNSCVLFVIPSPHFRRVFRQTLPALTGSETLVSATKGLETSTLLCMSEVMQEEAGDKACERIAVLSGPTFAREIASGQPAAIVVASASEEIASSVQRAFSGPVLRLYTNNDPAGVEIGAALKNVIAIGAGIIHGLGLGSNTMAALVTRGLAEITRLAVAAGGRRETLSGLAGLGDLLLTCTGDLSRNRHVGVELARGHKLPDILASTNMVPEGVETTFAAVELARKHGIEMPIAEQMRSVLESERSPADAIRALMERALRSE